MGFKDLYTFNMAMLAQQGWRINHRPKLLMMVILKARYFPNESSMNALVRVNPSYTRRSLLEGRKILNRGVVWRVGNGFIINIYGKTLGYPKVRISKSLPLNQKMQWFLEYNSSS